MKFLLQNKHQTEAVITLKRAQQYHSWKNDNKDIFIIVEDSCLNVNDIDPKEWCPIGSVGYCHSYYERHFGLNLKPLNVPLQLQHFAGRNIIDIKLPLPKKNIEKDFRIFIKSNDLEKWENNGVYQMSDLSSSNIFSTGSYQLSEIVDIVAEFRCFVYRGELLSVNRYLGDMWTYLNRNVVEQIIASYIDCPTCYTLDMAVICKSIYNDIEHKQDSMLVTGVLEVHDFYACGLYGFQDLEKLPFMYWASHLDKINNLHKV